VGRGLALPACSMASALVSNGPTAARLLLDDSTARPGDTLVMSHAGSDHDAMRGKLDIEDRSGRSGVRFVRHVKPADVRARSGETPLPVPDQPPDRERVLAPLGGQP